jgi:hypothetical protein
MAAMAAFCALAPAAPFGSQPQQPHPTHPAVPLFDILLDPDLNASILDGDQIPGLKPEAVLAGEPPPSSAQTAIVSIFFGSATLLAFTSLFLVTSHRLRTRPGRRKRLEYSSRTMAPLI